MTTDEAITLLEYRLQANNKKRALESYKIPLDRFRATYGQRSLEAINPDKILHFLEDMTRNPAQGSKKKL